MATQAPAAYAAASNFRLFKDTSRQSNILQSYSKQDVARLYNERQRLLNENRVLNGGSISFQGSAFNFYQMNVPYRRKFVTQFA